MTTARTTDQGLIPDERLRELAAKGWLLRFLVLKANPAWLIGLDVTPAGGPRS